MSSWRNQASRASPRGRGALLPKGTHMQRRQLEYIASVSRSSGLEPDGDTLKNFRIQEEYRSFLQEKVNAVPPRTVTETEKEAKSRIDAQENVLILFRKLREGISSSRRVDAFALEVYETSLYFAAAFESPRQTTSIVSHLVPTLYLTSPPPHKNCIFTILISLIHHLVEGYPSQRSYRQHFDTIPDSLFPRESAGSRWIISVAKSLRVQNYALFERLIRRSTVLTIMGGDDSLTDALKSLSLSPKDTTYTLPRRALLGLVDSLKRKSRKTTWGIICSAYREFSCNTPEGTRDWLERSLCLTPVASYEEKMEVEEWLDAQSALGNTRRKEGVVGRWIICRVR